MIVRACALMLLLAAALAVATVWAAHDSRARLHQAAWEGYGYSVGLPGSNL